MKNMKKLVAALAAATMVMSMGFSAFAEVITPGKVVDEDGAMTHITFVVDGEDISKSSESQITLLAYLIPEKDSNGVAYTAETIPAYSNQTIVALNQVGGSVGFGQIPVDTEKLEAGYAIAVKLGGSDGTVAQGIITYNVETNEVTVKFGDVDDDGEITTTDASLIKLYVAAANKDSYNTSKGTQIGVEVVTNVKYGDVDGDGEITTTDASLVKLYVAAANKDNYNTSKGTQIGVTKTYK